MKYLKCGSQPILFTEVTSSIIIGIEIMCFHIIAYYYLHFFLIKNLELFRLFFC